MFMSEAGLRHSLIRTPLAGVEKFLDVNRKLYHRKTLHSLITQDKDLGGGYEPFTNDDIAKMLSTTQKIRTKAIVLFLSSLGIRPSALVDPILKVVDLVEMPHDCYAIKIYDGSREGYWGFLTPESRKAIDAYLRTRKRNGEVITEDSPLFASYARHAKYKHMVPESLATTLQVLYRNAGIQRKKIGLRYNKALTYGFRKRFNTILKIDSSVNSNIAEKLMGHKRGLDGAYLTPTREECFAEFVKAIPELTVGEEERQKIELTKQQEKITQLSKEKKRISELEQTTRQLSERLQKQESMTAEINKIHAKIKETMNRESDSSNPHFPDGGPFDIRLVNLEIEEIKDKSIIIFDNEFCEEIPVVLRKDKVYCTIDKSTSCKHVLFALGNPDFYQLVKKNNISFSFSTRS